MEYELNHYEDSCSNCLLCRSRKRSEELLKKVQNTRPKWNSVDVTIKQETNNHHIGLKEAFANIMATLGATSIQCETYLGGCGSSMDDKDYLHFCRYHSDCSRDNAFKNSQTAHVHLNLTPEENRPLEEDEPFDSKDEGLAQTEPYHVYGTYDYDDLPCYQRPLQNQVHFAGKPVVRATAYVSPKRSYPTAPTYTNTLSGQGYKFHAQGTISPIPQRQKKPTTTSSGYHANCTTSYQPRSVHQRNKSAARPKSVQFHIERDAHRAKAECSGRAKSQSFDISIKAGSNFNPRRSENTLKLSSRPKPVRSHIDRVICLHPGQSATVRLVK